METTVSKRISIDPRVCHGKPGVTGTRVPVRTVVGALAAGQGVAGLLEDVPTPTEADIQACLSFADRPAQSEMSAA
ncbi:MAG: DUF433 domain-containing protein [Undibacterium sp.]|nr:DUF433 domain-containing protein [Opitutaceae bacterium]